ncbi:uncharacterized protein PAC_05136 [Phialocephala subalpina]|uniref:Fungal N-terminal domain-containing protein n=1 Tax=Phialocephala subalpina TaxID=576137 RepID=A0A1L7WR58_9HELO|nr:uncharacterized protein PAC_05136 [Phialocephala subalpina]
MAALRLGIGDVFTCCKAAIDICTTLPHQPNHIETSSIITEMQLMRSHLQTLESQIGDEGVFSSARPDMCVSFPPSLHLLSVHVDELGADDYLNGRAPIIKQSLKPLYHDLTALAQTMNQHQNRKTSVHVLDQARYLMLYKAKLQGFGDKIPGHRESICLMRELIEEENHEERRKSIVRLESICEEQKRRGESFERAQVEMLRIWEEGEAGEDNDVGGQDLNEHVSGQDGQAQAWKDQKPVFDLDIFDRMSDCNHVRDFDSTTLSTLSPGVDNAEPCCEGVLISHM